MHLGMEKKRRKKKNLYLSSVSLLSTFMVLIVKAEEGELTSANYAGTSSELLGAGVQTEQTPG